MFRTFVYTATLFIFGKLFAQQVPLYEISNFGNNPGNLKLIAIKDSSSKKSTVKKPLVLVLHGCSQSAADIYNITGWHKLARKNGFILLFPQQKITNNVSQCFNWMLESDINKNGECLSIHNMIRYGIDSLGADSSKIFLYGVSAGACMSEVLCANYPWLINKAAICAGIPYRAATGTKTVKLAGATQVKKDSVWGSLVRLQNPLYKGKYPGIILMHGTEDFVADYGYATELVKQWSNVHGISSQSIAVDSSFASTKKVYRMSYGKNNEEIMVYYKIKGLGHIVPIDAGSGDKQGGEDKLFSEDIDFYSTYYIANDFGLIKNGK